MLDNLDSNQKKILIIVGIVIIIGIKIQMTKKYWMKIF